MTKTEYKNLDWQSQDEVFYEWVDQYLLDNGLPSWLEMGESYGDIDIIELRYEFLAELDNK